MKFKILAILLVAVVTSSCKKLLEPDPTKTGQSTSENFYTNYIGALQGINGIYASQRGIYNTWWFLDQLSDDSFAGQSLERLDNNNFSVSDGTVTSVWNDHYRTIGIINIYLDRIPNVTGLSPNENILRNQYVAEAKCIRANLYFNLVRLFGGVPLVVTEERDLKKLDIPRASVAEVYAQIRKDLLEAIAVLPAVYPNPDLIQPVSANLLGGSNSGRERGRATKIFAKTLLGHAYLTEQNETGFASADFVNADLYLSQALSDALANNVVLNPAFSTNFEAISGTAHTPESVFEIDFSTRGSSGAQNSFPFNFAPAEENTSLNGNQPTDKSLQLMSNMNNTLAEAFQPGDTRKGVTIRYNFIEYPITATSQRSIDAKFYKKGQASNDGFYNWPVYRLSDVILLAAEAKQALGDDAAALTLLNRVHTPARTGLALYPTTGLGVLTGTALRDAIRLERRVELAMEAKRYFDLLRWGTLNTVMTAHGFPVTNTARKGLLPIPQGQRDLNPSLTQNPGY